MSTDDTNPPEEPLHRAHYPTKGFCTYCGNTLADDAQFCSTCGKPQSNHTDNNVYVAPTYCPPPKTSWSDGEMIALVIVSLLIPCIGICVGIWGLTKPDKEGQGMALLVLGIVMMIAGLIIRDQMIHAQQTPQQPSSSP